GAGGVGGGERGRGVKGLGGGEREGRLRFIVGEGGLPLGALPLPPPLRRRLGRTAGLIAMGRDSSTGTIEYDGQGLRTETGRAVDPGMFADIERAMDQITVAYRARRTWLNAPAGRGAARLATVHPLGGCAVGRTPEDGVVD